MKRNLAQIVGIDLNAREKTSLRGGDKDYTCCKLVCFNEEFSCGPTGTGSCDGVYNPDPENCTVAKVPCSECDALE